MIEDKVVDGEMRGYLGLSQIGNECSRALWYDFRFASKKRFSARIARLFARGHREEPIIIRDLEDIGINVHSDQAEVTCGYGHIKGHIDGIAGNVPDAPKTPHLLEFKTANDKKFKKLIELQNYCEWNSVYEAQVHCYMHLLKLNRALVVVVNKNDDSRYYERIERDSAVTTETIRKGEGIILSEYPLDRLPPTNGRGHHWKCSWCDHKAICLHQAEPLRNCRTCQYCDMENNGKWSCSEKERNGQTYFLTLEQQIAGCKDWRKMKGLL